MNKINNIQDLWDKYQRYNIRVMRISGEKKCSENKNIQNNND